MVHAEYLLFCVVLSLAGGVFGQHAAETPGLNDVNSAVTPHHQPNVKKITCVIDEKDHRVNHKNHHHLSSHSNRRNDHSGDDEEEKLRERYHALDIIVKAVGLGSVALFVVIVSVAWFCCSSHSGSPLPTHLCPRAGARSDRVKGYHAITGNSKKQTPTISPDSGKEHCSIVNV